jgi:hypothetical protein
MITYAIEYNLLDETEEYLLDLYEVTNEVTAMYGRLFWKISSQKVKALKENRPCSIERELELLNELGYTDTHTALNFWKGG